MTSQSYGVAGKPVYKCCNNMQSLAEHVQELLVQLIAEGCPLIPDVAQQRARMDDLVDKFIRESPAPQDGEQCPSTEKKTLERLSGGPRRKDLVGCIYSRDALGRYKEIVDAAKKMCGVNWKVTVLIAGIQADEAPPPPPPPPLPPPPMSAPPALCCCAAQSELPQVTVVLPVDGPSVRLGDAVPSIAAEGALGMGAMTITRPATTSVAEVDLPFSAGPAAQTFGIAASVAPFGPISRQLLEEWFDTRRARGEQTSDEVVRVFKEQILATGASAGQEKGPKAAEEIRSLKDSETVLVGFGTAIDPAVMSLEMEDPSTNASPAALEMRVRDQIALLSGQLPLSDSARKLWMEAVESVAEAKPEAIKANGGIARLQRLFDQAIGPQFWVPQVDGMALKAGLAEASSILNRLKVSLAGTGQQDRRDVLEQIAARTGATLAFDLFSVDPFASKTVAECLVKALTDREKSRIVRSTFASRVAQCTTGTKGAIGVDGAIVRGSASTTNFDYVRLWLTLENAWQYTALTTTVGLDVRRTTPLESQKDFGLGGRLGARFTAGAQAYTASVEASVVRAPFLYMGTSGAAKNEIGLEGGAAMSAPLPFGLSGQVGGRLIWGFGCGGGPVDTGARCDARAIASVGWVTSAGLFAKIGDAIGMPIR